jgi:hypothetical protein
MGLFLAKLNSKNPNIAAFYFCKTQDFYFRSLKIFKSARVAARSSEKSSATKCSLLADL